MTRRLVCGKRCEVRANWDWLMRIRRKVIVSESGCWEYPTTQKNNGYIKVAYRGERYWLHRLMFTTVISPIENGQQVHHTCHNRHCCNPRHLEVLAAVTHAKHHYANGNALSRKNGDA